MTVDAVGVLRNAYRATFQEYSSRLDALQRLMSSEAPDKARIEGALLDVEKARVAHNSARDRLAGKLVRSSLPPGADADEHDIRKTAQLLWELAGRPDGTAERDWQRAEQLVHAAASAR
jgi:hypothetical protein